MSELKKIDSTITSMCTLLNKANQTGWERSLSSLRANLFSDPKVTANSLLRLYGGMGSLNDIVLYSNGQPMVQENREFDKLREQLYELCRKV